MTWISSNKKDYKKIFEKDIEGYLEIDEYMSDHKNCPICGEITQWMKLSCSNQMEYIQICKKCKVILSCFFEEVYQ